VRTNRSPAEGADLAVYQARLPLSTATIQMVGDLIRRRIRAIGSRWRKLPPGRQAVIVLAVLRHDQRLCDLAGGNGISASTVRRWLLEVIGLLAAKAPRLDRVLRKIARSGGEAVLIDGTLVRTRRRTGKANRRNYSGKHKVHGLLFLGITDTAGNLLWISAAKPGRASDLTAARHNKICAKLRAAGLGALGDLGFTALDDNPEDPVIITGRRRARKRPLTPAQKEANKLVSREDRLLPLVWAVEYFVIGSVLAPGPPTDHDTATADRNDPPPGLEPLLQSGPAQRELAFEAGLAALVRGFSAELAEHHARLGRDEAL
jgi:hypothetical protein